MISSCSDRYDVIVIGGGFCGIAAAWQLVSRSTLSRVLLIERDTPFGPAYRSPAPAHLLNTPAGRMTARPDQPLDFVEFARRQGYKADPDDFLPRRVYRDYLDYGLTQSRRAGLHEWHDEAITLERRYGGDWLVRCRSGRVPETRHVVVAIGADRPRTPAVLLPAAAHQAYRPDPWAPESVHIDSHERDDHIVLVGTGQTAIDSLLELDRQGHRGPVIAVSRHGLVPEPHASEPSADLAIDPDTWPTHSAVALSRAVRRRMREAKDWRTVCDALRSSADFLWQCLSDRERARLLRHARPYWDISRHRLAPGVARHLEKLRASGRIRFVAGHIQGCDTSRPADLGLAVRLRGQSDVIHWRADRLINCTGLCTDPTLSPSPLVQHLLASGHATIAPQRLGLTVQQPGLHIVGARSRGTVWEHTAVPELAADVRHSVERIEDAFRADAA